MALYHFNFLLLLVITCALGWHARPVTRETVPKDFPAFKRSFLVGYALCVAGDALTSAYGIVLYMSYKLTGEEIGAIFALSTLLSFFFIWRIGPAADKYGRKKLCLMYCAMNIASSVLMHFRILLGMILAATLSMVSQAILMSVFEVWMVSEHTVQRAFPGTLLAYMFQLMYNWHTAVRIACGMLTAIAVSISSFGPVYEGSHVHVGGILNTYALAGFVLAGAAVYLNSRWAENYGDSIAEGTFRDRMREGWQLVRKDKAVLELGVMVVSFQSAWIALLFSWAKALHVDHSASGLILGAFGMAASCGTSCCTLASNRMGSSFGVAMSMMLLLFGGSFLAMAIASFCHGLESMRGTVALALIAFQFFYGWFQPVLGMLKGEIVPEEMRSTMYTMYDLSARFLGVLVGVRGPQALGLSAAALLLGLLAAADLRGGRPAASEDGGGGGSVKDGDAFFSKASKAV